MDSETVKVLLTIAGVLIGIGTFLTPIIMAARNRDMAFNDRITEVKEEVDARAVERADALHERVNRVRDEYVRRDDFNSHMGRIDKTIDSLRSELHSGFQEIKQLIRGQQ